MKIVLNKIRPIFSIGVAVFYSMVVTLPLVAAQELLPVPVQSAEKVYTVEEIAQASCQLRSAAQAGDIEKVRQALNAGADINGCSSISGGYTPLIFAVGQGHAATVDMLIGAKAEVNQANEHSYLWTPLMLASSHGRADVVGMLLKAKAEVNQANSCDLTPLYRAVYRDHAGVVDMLIEAGADDSKLDDITITPEMRAVIDVAKVKRDVLQAQAAEVEQAQVAEVEQRCALQQQAAEVVQEKAVQEKAEEIKQDVLDVQSELEQVACIAVELAGECKLEANEQEDWLLLVLQDLTESMGQ
ncbi:MAG: ankyrin repeat domain-containing protein [Candidatus Dependentiae bacterium]|nr:ankyrin repeat domain-containing protein [Candidatus Dependentiae bacterium]